MDSLQVSYCECDHNEFSEDKWCERYCADLNKFVFKQDQSDEHDNATCKWKVEIKNTAKIDAKNAIPRRCQTETTQNPLA